MIFLMEMEILKIFLIKKVGDLAQQSPENKWMPIKSDSITDYYSMLYNSGMDIWQQCQISFKYVYEVMGLAPPPNNIYVILGADKQFPFFLPNNLRHKNIYHVRLFTHNLPT